MILVQISSIFEQLKRIESESRNRGSCVKTFIATIQSLDKRSNISELSVTSQRRGPIFITAWDDLVINKVEIRGVVIGCHAVGSSGFHFTVDDGTSRISAVVWFFENEAKFPSAHSLYNKFVSVSGTLVGFRTDIQIKVDSISVIAEEEECTEEGIWWLDVQQEWESLASAARSVSKADFACPCLCHSGSNIPCRCLGSPSVWSPVFNRAVSVISTALRTVTPSGLSMSELVKLVSESSSLSPCLQASPCVPDCATAVAMRQLLREGYASRIGDTGKFRVASQPEQTTPVDHERFSRYPLSQLPDQEDDPMVPETEFKPKSKPKFISACDAFPS